MKNSLSFVLCFQATAWISQLRDATEHNLGDVGRNSEDVEALQQEHEKLEGTARVRGVGRVGHSAVFYNKPFSSCFEPHFERESKCNIFIVKISFIPM